MESDSPRHRRDKDETRRIKVFFNYFSYFFNSINLPSFSFTFLLSFLKGLISYNEFRRVFQASEEDLESRCGIGGSNTFEFIPPKQITEIAEQFSV